jgi:phage-related minor tail protein
MRLVDLVTASLAGMAAVGFPQAFPAPPLNTPAVAVARQTILFLPVLEFLAAAMAAVMERPARREQLILAAVVAAVDLVAAGAMAVQAL